MISMIKSCHAKVNLGFLKMIDVLQPSLTNWHFHLTLQILLLIPFTAAHFLYPPLLNLFEVDLYASDPEHRKFTIAKFLLLESRLSEHLFFSGYAIVQAACSWHE